jgi:hypothetical protein
LIEIEDEVEGSGAGPQDRKNASKLACALRQRIIAMKNDPNDRYHLDQTDEEILTSDVSDEALEVAAGMGGTGPTASINIVPPNCC